MLDTTLITEAARLGFVSAGRVLLSVRHTVEIAGKFSHNHPSNLPAVLSLQNVIHQPSLVELHSVPAHTNPHTQAHMHRQIKSMATFLHIRKCCTVGGQQRSPPTHRIFNCKHVQIHPLYLSHVHMRSTTFIHAPLGKYCSSMHTHTCRSNIEANTQAPPFCHK